MSENIQPASEENKIVEDFKNEKPSENSSGVKDEQLLKTKQITTDKRRFGILVKTFFMELHFHLFILMQRVQRKEHSSSTRQTSKNQYIFLSRR